MYTALIHIGLFIEDINYALDGGLYAEMLENRDFEGMDVCGGNGKDYYAKYDGIRAHQAGALETVHIIHIMTLG